ncbi:MAG: outer membrane protein assembly factor BamE domain-containing protein [Chromatiales bacterium]
MSRSCFSTRAVLLALVIGFSLALTGCGSKINKTNANMVNTGMTEQEVTDLLGPPSETTEFNVPDLGALTGGNTSEMPGILKGAKHSVWREDQKVIMITFVNGKVIAKQASGL